MLGLKNGHIELTPYNPKWQSLFHEEKERLLQMLAPFNPLIEHIGSTAIPSICAKPMLDVLIGLPSLTMAQRFPKETLKQHHIYPLERVKIQGKIVYAQFSDVEEAIKTMVLHIVEKDGQWWRDHLYFRDYLRTHEDARLRYEQLKKHLAERHATNQNDYSNAKESFVKEILATHEGK
ncbi:GrpB family protein [Bacillus sp. FSL W7-1360]